MLIIISRMRKYFLWIISIAVICAIAFYFINLNQNVNSSASVCSKFSSDQRDACCLNQSRSVVVVSCQGNWEFNNSTSQCDYICSPNSSNYSSQNITNVQNFTKPSGLFCTAEVKQCPDGSFVSRDTALHCDFKPCPTNSSK